MIQNIAQVKFFESSSKILSFAHLSRHKYIEENATGFQNQRCKASWAPEPLAGIFFFFFCFLRFVFSSSSFV